MHEVASGSELAVTVLVIVSALLLFKRWLMLYQFLDAVSEVAILAVLAVTALGKGSAQLYFAFLTSLVIWNASAVNTYTHFLILMSI